MEHSVLYKYFLPTVQIEYVYEIELVFRYKIKIVYSVLEIKQKILHFFFKFNHSTNFILFTY